jgi:hypothetical protein
MLSTIPEDNSNTQPDDERRIRRAVLDNELALLDGAPCWMYDCSVGTRIKRGHAKFTPLGYACAIGRSLVVRHLLSLGVDRSIPCCVYCHENHPIRQFTMNAAECAILCGNLDIVQILWNIETDPIAPMLTSLDKIFRNPYRVSTPDTNTCLAVLLDVFEKRRRIEIISTLCWISGCILDWHDAMFHLIEKVQKIWETY